MSRWALLVLLLIVRGSEERKEYEVLIERVDVVRDPKFILESDFYHVAKNNDTTFVVNFSGNLTEDLPLDTVLSHMAYEESLPKIQDSMIPVKLMRSRVCDFIKRDKMFYPPLLSVSNFPSACPIKKGHYEIKDFIPNLDKMTEKLSKGRWRCEQTFTSKKQTLFKMIAIVSLKKI